jgi:hypothetical protein
MTSPEPTPTDLQEIILAELAFVPRDDAPP